MTRCRFRFAFLLLFSTPTTIRRPSRTSVSLYGNVVLADHGLSFSDRPLATVPGPSLSYPADAAANRCTPALPTPLPVRFRPAVPDSPITQAVPLAIVPLAGVGNPVTPAVVLFAGGPIDLADSNGFACLSLIATNPAAWPHNFGVMVAANAVHPANIDLAVVYNPPGGAAGIHAQVILEKFTDLSFNAADPNVPGAPNQQRLEVDSRTRVVHSARRPAGRFPCRSYDACEYRQRESCRSQQPSGDLSHSGRRRPIDVAAAVRRAGASQFARPGAFRSFGSLRSRIGRHRRDAARYRRTLRRP